MRIQPDRQDDFDQLSRARFAVHTRSDAFGDAVLALLVRAGGVVPQPGRLRVAGRWLGREQELMPDQAKWTVKLNAFQAATLAGLGWLVLAFTGMPLTLGKEAHVPSRAPLFFLVAGPIACSGVRLVAQHGPKQIKAPGPRAARFNPLPVVESRVFNAVSVQPPPVRPRCESMSAHLHQSM
jgi:hypothetical protein